ncbi:DNA primase [Pseudoclavibacter terrae]|uniref:DNA primase n=1 Tax=Pseudoclavibacter terrae TaxID=1530195 RepID=A0A7J5B6N5_9MICO|nr:DNA primase [Pseudoclavibacter terrae]KAB1639856.1 DNA primase [Pseudoclavibacter terrae]
MDSRRCEVCGERINLSRVDARTCGPRCRKRLSRRAPFPGVMLAEDRWIRWELTPRGGKLTKLPLRLDGSLASSTDPASWSSYRDATASTAGDGLGFVLGAGIGCVDLDDCLADGMLADWALAELDGRRADALLVEVSQSGKGLHIFLPMAQGKGRVIRDGERHVEIYPPDSGRFIAVTGRHYRG